MGMDAVREALVDGLALVIILALVALAMGGAAG